VDDRDVVATTRHEARKVKAVRADAAVARGARQIRCDNANAAHVRREKKFVASADWQAWSWRRLFNAGWCGLKRE
jgi:hypothetical protein